MQKPKSWAVLTVAGNFRPDEFSRDLGISPDFFEETNSKSGTTGFWQIHSKLSADHALEEHLWEILKRLAPVRLIFKKMIIGIECTIYASVEFSDESTRGIDFSPRILSILGNLGIRFELNPWLNKSNQGQAGLMGTN
ncbi:MAG: DUF4279 domain-containing protein [Leptospiraceae bacterium]|nr:DUF4279 domain-containing protein [Leptospiraceae bacterium]MCK6380962.1 DUF4279 domain-containing protein [Leptospiraceae bacterium]NUM40943.1 DUF4279 domain-containing protein [Leptospiraceae bacterium]